MPRQANSLSPVRLRELARIGAETTINDLRAQISAIERAFPDRRRSLTARQANGAAGGPQGQRRRRRRGMSAAARKAVSLRMKKYWAGRRKAKAAGK